MNWKVAPYCVCVMQRPTKEKEVNKRIGMTAGNKRSSG
jgi:hypothetical protein